ncbi:MAG: arylesterase [Robiginitomaculum sp.]|nr:arylesterase [Robiginitomaculum sp.]MDQ7077004.1 arylesterase [Robiginitomaculum sp.]
MRKHKHFAVMAALLGLVTACSPAAAPIVQASQEGMTTAKSAPIPPAEDRYSLVILGDSLTAGFGLAPDEDFPHIIQGDFETQGRSVAILNAGVSGDTSAAGLARFDWAVGPDANGVLIALGANDMLNGLDPAQTRQNLVAMIEKAKARKLDVFLAGMRAAPNLGTAYGAQFDRLYGDLATQYCVALYPFLMQPLVSKDGTAIDQDLIQRDGLHPTAAGAARIGHALSDWLASALESSHIPCSSD